MENLKNWKDFNFILGGQNIDTTPIIYVENPDAKLKEDFADKMELLYGINPMKPIAFDYADDVLNSQKEILINLATKGLEQKETIFLSALKKHGFEFDSKAEIEDFCKTRIDAVKPKDSKHITYYADGIPFLVWFDRPETKIEDNTITSQWHYKIL